MFGASKAFSGFAVGDLEQARAFYGDTLGLETSEDNGLLTLHLAGARDVLDKFDFDAQITRLARSSARAR